MSQGHAPAFDDDTVYRRTDKGRAALLALPATLSQASVGFLARVNGFTDLRTLLDQEGDDESQADVAQAIEALLAQHFIEVVPPAAPPIGAAGTHTGALAA